MFSGLCLEELGVGLIRLLNICVGEEDFLQNHLRASLNLPAHGVFGDSVQVLKPTCGCLRLIPSNKQ